MKKIFFILFFLVYLTVFSQYLFIPMNNEQTNHLKAYGIVYRMLQKGIKTHWLLDYKGGSFIIENSDKAYKDAYKNGVKAYQINENEKQMLIYETQRMNSREVILEKAPKIAVYSPPDKEPWDDAVTLVLKYAGIEYDVIYDKEILNGKLYKYDWLHLHHEDFTGQFDRFYISAYNQKWFRDMYNSTVKLAKQLGYTKYWLMKRDVAREIANYVNKGGFLFSMCSGTNSIDIALALGNQDNIPAILDGDGTEIIKLDYSHTFAFQNFSLNENPTMNLADINKEPSYRMEWEGMKFTLNYFAPKTDVVEAMLNQNHTKYVKEFLGRTTSYDKSKLKPNVIVLASAVNKEYAKYIHGNYGEGFFTFLAGHDPEDYVHYVYDPPTDLDLYRHSPGYRLILNNVLFPASKEKKKKT